MDAICDCEERDKCDIETDINLSEITDLKKCIYCGCYFSRINFPQTFNRQLTCGCVNCEGIRRKKLWHKRYNKMMKAKA